MIVTLEEAQANLPQFVDRAATGEDVFISVGGESSLIKLEALKQNGSRLARHPDLAGSTQMIDPEALTKPLPAEEWGGLADS